MKVVNALNSIYIQGDIVWLYFTGHIPQPGEGRGENLTAAPKGNCSPLSSQPRREEGGETWASASSTKRKSLSPLSASMSTDPTKTLDVVEELKSFLYTPYGVSTLAAAAVVLTCVLWCVGCCILCFCHQRRHRHNLEGTLEANREIEYFGVVNMSSTQQQGGGTMSSGYNSNTGNSLAGANNNLFATSLDSIVDTEA